MQGGKRNRSAAGPAGGSSLVRDPPAQALVGRNCGAGELPWSPSPHPPLFQAHHPAPDLLPPSGCAHRSAPGGAQAEGFQETSRCLAGGENWELCMEAPQGSRNWGPGTGRAARTPGGRAGLPGLPEGGQEGGLDFGAKPGWLLCRLGVASLEGVPAPQAPGSAREQLLPRSGLEGPAGTHSGLLSAKPALVPNHPACSRRLPGHSRGQPGQDPRTPNL